MMVFQLNKKVVALFVAGIIFLVFVLAHQIRAQESTTEGLQILLSGKLTDPQETIAQDGTYNMSFALYDTATSTDNVWSEIFAGADKVIVTAGMFQVSLGLTNPFNLDFDNNTYWLGIKVGGIEEEPTWDKEMEPRIQVTTLKNLLFEGRIIMTEEELVQALIEEFQKNATSTEPFSQQAFVNFLKQKLAQTGSNAVIISPRTISLLLEEILNLQQQSEQAQEDKTFWRSLLSFFTKIFDTISEKLGNIFEKINDIFSRLDKIDQGVNQILNVLGQQQQNNCIQQQTSVVEPILDLNSNSDYTVKEFGKTSIISGEKTVRVFATSLTNESKMFVLPDQEIENTWWISDKKPGEYFELSISTTMDATINFEYWIITPKSQIPVEPNPIIEPESLPQGNPIPQEDMSTETGNTPEENIVPDIIPEENSSSTD